MSCGHRGVQSLLSEKIDFTPKGGKRRRGGAKERGGGGGGGDGEAKKKATRGLEMRDSSGPPIKKQTNPQALKEKKK